MSDSAADLRKDTLKSNDVNEVAVAQTQVRNRILNATSPAPVDFLHPFAELRYISVEKGRGMFAAASLKVGELIMVARPLACVALADMENGADPHVELARALQLKSHLPIVSEALSELIGSQDQYSAEDTSSLVHNNAFQIPHSDFVALFWKPSFCNHACNPNTSLLFFSEDNILVLRAARDLAVGEEITLRYFATTEMPLPSRRRRSSEWGFICQCDFCVFEYSCGPDLQRVYDSLAGPIAKACADFFRSVELNGPPEQAALLSLFDGMVSQIEESVKAHAKSKSEADLIRSLFASAYQVRRAILERIHSPLAVDAQQRVLAIFNAVEPGSLEHCKAAAIAHLFAKTVLGKREDLNLLIPTFRVLCQRYGFASVQEYYLLLTRVIESLDTEAIIIY